MSQDLPRERLDSNMKNSLSNYNQQQISMYNNIVDLPEEKIQDWNFNQNNTKFSDNTFDNDNKNNNKHKFKRKENVSSWKTDQRMSKSVNFPNSHLYLDSISHATNIKKPSETTKIPNISTSSIPVSEFGNSLSQQQPLDQFLDKYQFFECQIDKFRQLIPISLTQVGRINESILSLTRKKTDSRRISEADEFTTFFHKFQLFKSDLVPFIKQCRKILKQRKLNIRINQDAFDQAEFFRNNTFPQFVSIICNFEDKIHPLYNSELSVEFSNLVGSFNDYVSLCSTEAHSKHAIIEYKEMCKEKLDEIAKCLSDIKFFSNPENLKLSLENSCIKKLDEEVALTIDLLKTFGRFFESEIIPYTKPDEISVSGVINKFHESYTSLTQTVKNSPKVNPQFKSVLASLEFLKEAFSVLNQQIGKSPQPYIKKNLNKSKTLNKHTLTESISTTISTPSEICPILQSFHSLCEIFGYESHTFREENYLTPFIIKMAEKGLIKSKKNEDLQFSTKNEKGSFLVSISDEPEDPIIKAFKQQNREINVEFPKLVSQIEADFKKLVESHQKLKDRLTILEPLQKKDAIVDRLQQIRQFKDEMEIRNAKEQENFKLRFIGQLRSLMRINSNNSDKTLERMKIDEEMRYCFNELKIQLEENKKIDQEVAETIKFLRENHEQPLPEEESLLSITKTVISTLTNKIKKMKQQSSDPSKEESKTQRLLIQIIQDISQNKNNQNDELNSLSVNEIVQKIKSLCLQKEKFIDQGKKNIQKLEEEVHLLNSKIEKLQQGIQNDKKQIIEMDEKSSNLKQTLSSTLLDLHGRLQAIAYPNLDEEKTLPSTFEQTTNEIEKFLNLIEKENQVHVETEKQHSKFLKQLYSEMELTDPDHNMNSKDVEERILKSLETKKHISTDNDETIRKQFLSHLISKISPTENSQDLLIKKSLNDLEKMLEKEVLESLNTIESLRNEINNFKEHHQPQSNQDNENEICTFETAVIHPLQDIEINDSSRTHEKEEEEDFDAF